MAIKSVEDTLRQIASEQALDIGRLTAERDRAREESELWQRKYLDAARVWPTVTVGLAMLAIGFAAGFVV